MVLLVPLAYAPRAAQAAPANPSPAARFVIEHATRSDLLYWTALQGARWLIVKTILATPPKVLTAIRRASSADIPRAMFSSTWYSRCARNSRSSSSSARAAAWTSRRRDK